MNETDTLNQAIEVVKARQALEFKLLKDQFHTTYESLKPINLIKSTFQEIKETPQLKNKISEGAIGLTIGYLTKKIFLRSSHNPIKMIVGTILQVAVTNLALKHADKIVTLGSSVVKGIAKIKGIGKAEPDRYEDVY